MLRIINLVFIFLLLSIYSMKKLKTTQTQCKVIKENVDNVSNNGMRNVFIADGKLYSVVGANAPVEIKGIKPKLVETQSQRSFVIDTDDNLRIVNYPMRKNDNINITSAETFPGTYSNLIRHEVGPLAIRKNDSAIMRLYGGRLIEFAKPVPDIKQICGSRFIYLYTKDNYLAFLNPKKDYSIERMTKNRKDPIAINPDSKLSCADYGVFYGAKDSNELTLLFEGNQVHFQTLRPITEKIISYNRNKKSVTILSAKNEWQDCSNLFA